jgi:hypothetical protein
MHICIYIYIYVYIYIYMYIYICIYILVYMQVYIGVHVGIYKERWDMRALALLALLGQAGTSFTCFPETSGH